MRAISDVAFHRRIVALEIPGGGGMQVEWICEVSQVEIDPRRLRA